MGGARLAVGGKPHFARSHRSLPGTLMFDIGFSEMIVCAVVALVVIGPERCRASRARSEFFSAACSVMSRR